MALLVLVVVLLALVAGVVATGRRSARRSRPEEPAEELDPAADPTGAQDRDWLRYAAGGALPGVFLHGHGGGPGGFDGGPGDPG